MIGALVLSLVLSQPFAALPRIELVDVCRDPQRLPAELTRVIDADTYVMRVQFPTDVFRMMPFELYGNPRIRLAGLDTPERFTPEGIRATAFVSLLLLVGSIEVVPTRAVTLGRDVAHVCVEGRSVATALREAGFEKTPQGR